MKIERSDWITKLFDFVVHSFLLPSVPFHQHFSFPIVRCGCKRITIEKLLYKLE